MRVAFSRGCRSLAVVAVSLASLTSVFLRADVPALKGLDALYPEIETLYRELHQAPELSLHEEKTSAKMADQLRRAGYQVTEKVGGWGVVGILRNGGGPTILVRTDMDGLPLEEKTGVSFASRATGLDPAGRVVPTMHACGHDLHMSEWIATATLLARATNQWRGTLMFIGQPAEEVGQGAEAMIGDHLFDRFGKPDFAVALHDSANLPAGTIGYHVGFCYANVDSVDITFFGKGGHGAHPHKTIDPIVMAARFVTAVQTVVSRENDPVEPGVITVGSFHAGLKHNIIPDDAKLQLTVRSYKEEVRKRLLVGIERIAKAEAQAAGASREPEIRLSEFIPATFNDPGLTQRLVDRLKAEFGADKLVEIPASMGGEDFSVYGRNGIPACMLSLGAVNPARYAAAKAAGQDLPSLHSPLFLPDIAPTLHSGIQGMTLMVLELLNRP